MKDLEWLKNDLIAHRGLYKQDQSIPENSLSAFKNALMHGYSIELDLTLLKDNTVISFHDEDFFRLCGDKRMICDVESKDLKDLTYLNTNETIPLLKDVLELVAGRVPLLIELKPFGNLLALCEETMKIMKDYAGKWAVFSFHPKVVKWFKKNHPEIIRGQITSFFKTNDKLGFISKYLMKSLFFNRFNKPDFISYYIGDLPNKYADRFKKKGKVVISFSAKSQAEFTFVKRHYDNVVFEFFQPK